MLIPNLNVTLADGWAESLIDQVRHWSIFGRTCLTLPDPVSQELVEGLVWVIKRTGGLVDLQIRSDSISEDNALKLLNDGATSIVCSSEFSKSVEVIPDNRLIVLSRSDSSSLTDGQQVCLSDPTVAQLAELETSRVDCLVEVEFLDANPDFTGEFFSAILKTDRPDGLWPTVITDSLGIALGLAYSNAESLNHALKTRQGTYWSRSRNGLWIKGATSGATQQLLGVRIDCDRDCLRFTVTQDAPGFCHRNTHTCFGDERSIATVVQRLAERIQSPDAKSFTKKLANDPVMLRTKLLEEAGELSDASQTDDLHEIAWEAADVLYFSLVAMLNKGVGLEEVHQELARRMNRVVRRKNKLEP